MRQFCKNNCIVTFILMHHFLLNSLDFKKYFYECCKMQKIMAFFDLQCNITNINFGKDERNCKVNKDSFLPRNANLKAFQTYHDVT